MSKLYKATIYIDDINEMYESFEQIKNVMDMYLEDITFTFEKVQEKDTTDYIDKVGDNYPWNTNDEYVRSVRLHNFFVGDELNK